MKSEEIKALRNRLGFTQEQLARDLCVSFATINRWENGRSRPKGIFLKALNAISKRKQVTPNE